jgi:hypothetical protein
MVCSKADVAERVVTKENNRDNRGSNSNADVAERVAAPGSTSSKNSGGLQQS